MATLVTERARILRFAYIAYILYTAWRNSKILHLLTEYDDVLYMIITINQLLFTYIYLLIGLCEVRTESSFLFCINFRVTKRTKWHCISASFLSASFHHCPTLVFILLLLWLEEEEAGYVWKPSNKAMLFVVVGDHWIGTAFRLFPDLQVVSSFVFIYTRSVLYVA